MALTSRKSLQLLIILVGLFSISTSHAIAAKRVALVIGNSNYQNTSSLKNPVNDANLMATSLEQAGFEVTKILDADYRTLKKSLLAFGRRLYNKPEAGLFYYAGHGVQVRGENYLIPVNANIDKEDEIDFEAIPVNDFLRVMNSSTSNINIVVLDACRNNPFARSFRSASRGLAPVDAPKGTYIAYATAPGDVAADGKGKNSPYTIALTEAMKIRGIAIEKVFKNARQSVLNATANAQVPWETSSITGDFFFLQQEKVVKKQPPAKSNLLNDQLKTSEAERAFGLISKSENLPLLKAFVKQFPNSFYTSIISARIEELNTRKIKVETEKQKAISEPGINNRLAKLREAERKWALLKSSKDVGALKKFANNFSDTAFGSIAESRIDLLGELALLEDAKKQTSRNRISSVETRITPGSIQVGGYTFLPSNQDGVGVVIGKAPKRNVLPRDSVVYVENRKVYTTVGFLELLEQLKAKGKSTVDLTLRSWAGRTGGKIYYATLKIDGSLIANIDKSTSKQRVLNFRGKKIYLPHNAVEVAIAQIYGDNIAIDYKSAALKIVYSYAYDGDKKALEVLTKNPDKLPIEFRKAIQRKLSYGLYALNSINDRYYQGKIDGNIGPATLRALERFRADVR